LVPVTLLLAASPAAAQRLSPHDVTSVVVDGNRVSVYYGRPYITHPRTGEVRTIWGGLVPVGKVWRTGANEATLFITQQKILLGDAEIPAGAYTLFTLLKEDGSAELIVNRQIGQWGTQYDASQDFVRIPLEREE